ncbi:hypothetical protein FHS53_002349 [Xanthobacter tagetidis]|nr:hypothetical protein [Xanthobacter tagetidis]
MRNAQVPGIAVLGVGAAVAWASGQAGGRRRAEDRRHAHNPEDGRFPYPQPNIACAFRSAAASESTSAVVL